MMWGGRERTSTKSGDSTLSAVTEEDASRRLPATLIIAVVLLGSQGVALLALGVVAGVGSLGGDVTDRTAGLTETVFAAAGGVLLGLLGYWLLRGHRAARVPSMVLELMLLPVGYYMIQAGIAWAGVLAIVLGLGVCGLLLAPSTRRCLGID